MTTTKCQYYATSNMPVNIMPRNSRKHDQLSELRFCALLTLWFLIKVNLKCSNMFWETDFPNWMLTKDSLYKLCELGDALSRSWPSWRLLCLDTYPCRTYIIVCFQTMSQLVEMLETAGVNVSERKFKSKKGIDSSFQPFVRSPLIPCSR